MTKTAIQNKITDFLYNKPEILFAYIFGSFIQTDHYHDIDIGVFLSDHFDVNDLKNYPYGYGSYLIGELARLVKRDFDVVVMNKAEILIQHRIINKGILLFSRNENYRIFYVNQIRKNYIDAQHLRNIKRLYLLRNITNA